MTRRMVLGALLLVSGLTAVAGGLRLFPFESRAARAFLSPPTNCPAPCWQGIRPGLTGADDALRLLLAHPWIEDVDTAFNFSRADGWFNWKWSAQPMGAPVAGDHNSLRIDYNTVSRIWLATRIRFGDLWLALGAPDDARSMQFGDRVYVETIYREEAFLVQVELRCGAPARALWFSPVIVLWVKDLPRSYEPAALAWSQLTRCGGSGRLR